MSIAAFAYESLPESAHEAEGFYESVAEAARSGQRYRPLALLAMKAARAALSHGPADPEGELEAAFESEWEVTPAAIARHWSAAEAAPSATLMEHLGHAAAEAESNGESFAFLAPLLPLAMKALPLAAKFGAKLLPKAVSMVSKVAPKILKGVNSVAKTLRDNPVSKPLVRALPQVVQKTVADLSQQVADGKAITGDSAVRTLAKQTAQVLGNPQAVVDSVRRSSAVDRRFHKAIAAGCPPCQCQ